VTPVTLIAHTTMRPSLALFAGLLLAACATSPAGSAASSSTATSAGRITPSDGTALLAQMRDRYAGKWFRTLTFVQRTTMRRPDGTEQVSTWYEAQRGSRLRIDIGDPALGNGALYTADSLYVMRGGKVARAVAEGNPFLPLIVGVYLQPLDVTVAQIQKYKVDLGRLHRREWEGRPTYVVGASSPSDTTSPQFWVDRERLIVMRFLMPLVPSPESRNQDVRLENNVRVGGGWLATRVRILDKGVPLQSEDYADWKGDVALPESFFQAERWSEGPHWAKTAK
jgi:hypothetical protein